jgi:hypothetical protein
MNLFVEDAGYRIFSVANSTAQVLSGLVLNQNDELPITVQFVDSTGAAQTKTAWSASVVIVAVPIGSTPSTQLALTGLTTTDSISFTGTLQCNTAEMATFLGSAVAANCTLAVFATKNDLSQSFEVQLPITIQSRAYNNLSVSPTAPVGTQAIFNSTTQKYEWYINGILIFSKPD